MSLTKASQRALLSALTIVAALLALPAMASATTLLGDTTVESVGDGGTNTTETFSYPVKTPGTIDHISVYLTSTGGARVGVYADTSSKPGARLATGSVTSNKSGWVSIPVSPTIKAQVNTNYWLTIASQPGKRVTYRDKDAVGSNLDYSGNYQSGTTNGLADPYSIAHQWNSNPASVYGTGTAAPAAPTAAFTFSPQSPTTNDSVHLDGSSSTCPASPCTYSWNARLNEAGSTIGTGQTLDHTFSVAGTYSITLTATDAFGQTGSVNHSLTVSTPPPSTVNVFGNATPAQADVGGDNQVSLGLKFHANQTGNVTGVRFYKSTANTGTHIATLFDGNGTQLAQATYTNETGSGWQDVSFSSPVAIQPNTEYFVSYNTTVGHYADDAFYDWPKTALPLIADTGSYCYGDQNCFPGSRWNDANYYVDVDFQPVGPPPAPAPPSNTSAPNTTGADRVGDALSADPGTWNGDTPIQYAYQWQDCSGGNCSDISGATSPGYRIKASDLGDTIRVNVTATNGAGNSSAHSTETAAISNPTPSANGYFSIGSGGKILDPNGNLFTPVGVALPGSNWPWGTGQDDAASVSGMAPWHFNTVRLPIYTFCHPNVQCITVNNDIDSIVQAYTSLHYVVVLTQFDYGQNSNLTADQIASIKNYWTTEAAHFANNPYVWFDIANEPTSVATDEVSTWYSTMTDIADTVHAAAPNSMMVIEGDGVGQDKGTWNCTHAYGPSWSSSDPTVGSTGGLTHGADLQNRYGAQHVIFSIHAYDQWAGQLNYGCEGPSGPIDDKYKYWREDFQTYLNGMAAQNLPVWVGEYGSTSSQAAQLFPGQYNAARVLMEQVAPTQGVKVGVSHWACSPETGYPLANPDHWCLGYDPSQTTLDWQGSDLFNYAKLVNP